MGVAKTSMIVLVLLGYGVITGGVVLSNLPFGALLADPPIVPLAVSTAVAVGAVVGIEWLAP